MSNEDREHGQFEIKVNAPGWKSEVKFNGETVPNVVGVDLTVDTDSVPVLTVRQLLIVPQEITGEAAVKYVIDKVMIDDETAVRVYCELEKRLFPHRGAPASDSESC